VPDGVAAGGGRRRGEVHAAVGLGERGLDGGLDRAAVGRRRAVEELRRRRRHGRRGVAAQGLGRRQAQALDEARVARPEAA